MSLTTRIFPLLSAGCYCFFYCCYSSNGVATAPGDTLKPAYSFTRCGLNYTEASVVLGKKMKKYGMPYEGITQPAAMVISGIPATAKIEKAFVWFDLTGGLTAEDFIFENPSGIKDTFQGQLISSDAIGCWSDGTSAFRSDVTGIISGNGTYYISGLPTDTTFSLPDANGATLFIIYSDENAMNSGIIIIYEGSIQISFDTLTQSMYGLNITSGSTYAEAFMLVSDYENAPGNALKMNNGSYQSVADKFWNFEKKSTVMTQGQTTSEFGVRVPYDCVNFFLMGLYYRQVTDTTPPTITRASDTLISSTSTNYQWNLNGNPISGSTGKTFIADKPGIYSVSAANNVGCLITSDTFFVKCLIQYKAPIYRTGPQFWTDINFASFQWYFGTALIAGATAYQYTAPDTGYYSVKVVDTLGCTYYSDSLFTDLSGISAYENTRREINFFPNPATDQLIFEFSNTDEAVYEVKIFNIVGKNILIREISSRKNMKLTLSIDIRSFDNAVYFVQISENGRSVYRGKILKY